MRAWWLVGVMGSSLAAGCGGGASPAPPTTASTKASSGQENHEAKRAGAEVQVAGLEGTLQAYDVQEAMNARMDALAQCQGQRLRRVPHLAGSIKVAIHVELDGKVSQVDVISSDLGDVQTERCVAQVVEETRFPRPHGGEADVTWSLILDPTAREPEQWEAEQLAEQLELMLPDTSERCEMTRRSPEITVTAYVSRSGRVIAAGASSHDLAQRELMDCIAGDVQDWRLPKATRVAKVSFEARYKRPIDDDQKRAIRKKHAKRRKAEAKRRKAERRRKKRQARARRGHGSRG